MTSTKTIAKLRERIEQMDSIITSLTLENMNLKDDIKKYQERYEGIRDVLRTPGLSLSVAMVRP